ncbi:hypothetical protein GCM10010199_47930 [Dactylosporangium roseum]
MQPRSSRAAARRTAPRPRRTPKTQADPPTNDTKVSEPPPSKTDLAIEAAIKALVESAPPLSPETRERPADLLSASRRKLRP